MMKKISLIAFAGLFLLGIIMQSCEKDEGGNGTNISSYNSSGSHNMGRNCMTCHTSGGSGYGWFNVAGTVYNEQGTSLYPNATVRLYDGANGTGNLIATIEVDKNGNFYTTENIDFGGGLYPGVEGSTETKYMSSSLAIGQCNSCHGVSTDRIWTK